MHISMEINHTSGIAKPLASFSVSLRGPSSVPFPGGTGNAYILYLLARKLWAKKEERKEKEKVIIRRMFGLQC